jgi:hypothetical protein
MKQGADAVRKLAQAINTSIPRPIHFEPRGALVLTPPCLDPAPQLGVIHYVVQRGEYIPVEFVAAIQFREWVFTVERTPVSPAYYMCAFWEGREHANFGKIQAAEDQKLGTALIDWFMMNVAPAYAEMPDGAAPEEGGVRVGVTIEWH